MRYKSIRPGKTWLDTAGKPIQAHGGSVFYENGTYYFYGENKEKTDGKNGIWHYGVRAYASKDLYNWEDLGLIIPPNLSDKKSSLHPTSMMDRPHIIYNERTKKYVCWLKIMQKDGQTETVLTADKFTGPYTVVNENIRPCDFDAGDFDLVVDDKTKKAYYYFEKVHTETVCAELNDDYTDVTGVFTSHFPAKCPPFVREATAHFYRNNKHYILTSGTTGYLPNPSQVAVGDDYHGPFQILGNPHVNDKTKTSFCSQISSVFKVQGKKDLYIACADRWVPDLDVEKYPYDFYAKAFEYSFFSDKSKLEKLLTQWNKTGEDLDFVFGDIHRNTSLSTYVWLPLIFEGDDVKIYWKDEWSIEDFD